MKESGCPDVITYGGMGGESYKKWMHGYDQYFSSLNNRIDSTFSIRPFYNNAFDTLRHWLNDHGVGDTTGGLGVFVVDSVRYPMVSEKIKEGEAVDDEIITSWLASNSNGIVAHAMTIVGYNDSIKYDFNGDSIYSEDEYGAIKIVNSWGDSWMDSGYVYVSYKMFEEIAGPISNTVDVIKVDSIFSPEIVLKVKVDHEERDKLKFYTAFAENADSLLPRPQNQKYYKAISTKGGALPMQGTNYDPIEMALDFSYWFADSDVGKIFFQVYEKNTYSGDDTINRFSILDYRWNEVFELECLQANVPINNGFTTLSIEYDLLVPGDDQNIDNDDTLSSNMVCRFNPVVKDSSTLTIDRGVRIDLYDSELKINSGSEIIIEDSVIFHAKSGNCKLTINGDINDVSGVKFVADTGSSFEIYLDNSNLEVEFSNCDFENISFYGYTDSVTINNSTFVNSRIRGAHNLLVDSVSFDTSSIVMVAPGLSTAKATIKNSNFTLPHEDEDNLISLYRFATYVITGDTFSNYASSYSEGQNSISIEYSGTTGSTAINNISNNTFTSNGSVYSNTDGIQIYNSIANVFNNNIQEQNVGVMFCARSQSNLAGTEEFCYEDSTQVIKNNNLYQVYISDYSVPAEFIWNAIYHDTLTKCFVLHDYTHEAHPVRVEDNFWHDNHDPDSNLIPIDHYYYTPMHDPCSKSILAGTSAKSLYQSGVDQVVLGNYGDAKTIFQELVSEYPKTEQANNALKDIFNIEPLTDNDFVSLKSYYRSEDSIIGNERLEKLGENLANKCDEKLGNYTIAIDWYEDMIEDPPTLQDSVFAIIDLEHCYLLMGIDTAIKSSSYVGRMPQYKPQSVKAHHKHKDRLLVLLLHHRNQIHEQEAVFNDTESKKPTELLQNIPNPFKGITQIAYRLNIDSDVQLIVYNYNGQLIKTINEGIKSKGTYTTVLDASDLQSGIYFYSIRVNGQITDSKKMTIVK